MPLLSPHVCLYFVTTNFATVQFCHTTAPHSSNTGSSETQYRIVVLLGASVMRVPCIIVLCDRLVTDKAINLVKSNGIYILAALAGVAPSNATF